MKGKVALLILFGLLLIGAILAIAKQAFGALFFLGVIATIVDVCLHQDSWMSQIARNTLGGLFGASNSSTPEGCMMNVAITILMIPVMLLLGNIISFIGFFVLLFQVLGEIASGESSDESQPAGAQKAAEPNTAPATTSGTTPSASGNSAASAPDSTDVDKIWGSVLEFSVKPMTSAEGIKLISKYNTIVQKLMGDKEEN
ncbi:MAG: hypothetical protein J6X55_13410 [Victivallales bacterium]|nr:hypothetical protein [Victivallales bacterium]